MSKAINDNFKNEKYLVKNEKCKKENKFLLLTVNLLLLFSMLLYGINYIIMKYYIKINGSTYIFIILRTTLTIPLMIYMYTSNKSKPEKRKLLFEINEITEREKDTKKEIVPIQKNKDIYINENFPNNNENNDYMKLYEDNDKNESNNMSNNNINNKIDSCKYEMCVNAENSNDCALSGTSQNDEKIIPKIARIPIIILSVTSAFKQVIVITALQYTDSHNVGIIQPTIPIFTAIMSSYLKIEKINFITFLSILLSFIGLAITTEIWNTHAIDFGFLLLLTVPISKGLQVIYINIASKYVSNNIIQFFQMSSLIVIALPFGILGEILINKKYNIINEIYNLSTKQFLCILYSTIAIIFICWKIQIIALNHLTPITVSLYQSFQPCFTFILAKIFLNETISLNKYIGTIFIIVSLLLYQYGCYKRAKA